MIPNLVQYLRDQGTAGIGPPGPVFAGGLFFNGVTGPGVAGPDTDGTFLAARTTASGGGGRYGLFYIGIPYATGPTLTSSQWLYGLQQDITNRTNLALLNLDSAEQDPSVYRIELFDGNSGRKVNSIEGIVLSPGQWTQLNSILSHFAIGTTQSYARVSRSDGFGTFLAYAVINDGAAPGERTGDGAFIASSP